MAVEVINVTGDNFLDLGSKLNPDSAAYNFWTLIKNLEADNEDDSRENLLLVGDILKDKFGKDFTADDLEKWLGNTHKSPEDVMLELLDDGEIDELDEDEDLDDEIDNEEDDSDE